MATRIPEILRKYENELLAEWLNEQAPILSRDPKVREETREQTKTFLTLLAHATTHGNVDDPDGPDFRKVRALLVEISRQRGLAGFSPSETAMFVFSFKKALFTRMRKELSGDALADEMWTATNLLDRLGLLTTEAHQTAREDLIERQQQEMLRLSTPVVSLWTGILALPVIGMLDSRRMQVVMESLLQKIAETGADVVILDMTGVPMVDALVMEHLLKLIAAARLMGVDCMISGVRPQIAQTLVSLAIDMRHVTTKATLADAFAHALHRRGVELVSGAKH